MARPVGVGTVLVAGVAAQVAVATVGALPWAALPLTAGGLVAAGQLAARAEGRRSELLKHAGTALAVAATLVLAPVVVTAGDRQDLKVGLGLLLLIAQVAQALSWQADRDVRSGLLASSGLLVLAASYAPDVLVGFPLIVGWSAVMAGLARMSGLHRAEVARATALALVLGLVAFLLVPASPTEAARSRLAALANGAPIRDRSAPGAFTSGELDLRQRGNLPPTPVAWVPQDSPPLWRSTTYDVYDGVRWRRSTATRPLDGSGRYPVREAGRPTRTDEVQLGSARDTGTGTVWAPGPIVEITARGPVRSAAVNARGEVELRGLQAGYSVTSELPEEDPARLGSTSGQDVGGVYLDLPVSLPARVRALAQQITQGAPSRYAAANAVGDWLRANATYRLDSPVPLPGQDAVDRFLFVDRVGFCEQFASAQVVLLRAVGIPARLVTGLGYGEKDGGRRLYRLSNRHAWGEVWVQGTGWVAVDPTPAARNGSAAVAAAQTLRARVAGRLAQLLRRLTQVPGGRTTLVGVLLAVALAVLVGRRPRPRRRASSPRAQWAGGGPALAAFLRWDARQRERRRPAESLRELSARVPAPVREALEVVEAECYAPAGPDPQRVRTAVQVLDRS